MFGKISLIIAVLSKYKQYYYVGIAGVLALGIWWKYNAMTNHIESLQETISQQEQQLTERDLTIKWQNQRILDLAKKKAELEGKMGNAKKKDKQIDKDTKSKLDEIDKKQIGSCDEAMEALKEWSSKL